MKRFNDFKQLNHCVRALTVDKVMRLSAGARTAQTAKVAVLRSERGIYKTAPRQAGK